MIKTTKVIDVQEIEDRIIYDLFFALVEIQGNDLTYDVCPFEWEYTEHADREWKTRESSKTTGLKDALEYLKKWLIDNGITEQDDLMVKIWW